MAGLPLSLPAPSLMAPAQSPVVSLGGILPIGNLSTALPKPQNVEQQQSQPIVTNLAAHVRSLWTDAVDAKRDVETEMVEAMLARRGEYTSDKLAKIRENRQPVIYMMIAAGKMRQIESLVRDVIIGTGAEKPWTLKPSPEPELPPEAAQAVVEQLAMEIQSAMMTGFVPTMMQARERLKTLKDELTPRLMEEAARRCERMERKMEDQLVEGGYLQAFDEFITDLATFKTAFVAGPIVRRKPVLTWSKPNPLDPMAAMQPSTPIVEDELVLEWERVDPFDVYPAQYAKNLNHGPLIRRHRLSRQDLNEMIGVEGYSDDAIKKVLERYGDTGLREWLSIDSERAHAEGKDYESAAQPGQIDALQVWCDVSGKMLLDWGMDKESVPEPSKEYKAELWCIGPYVIKAVLNSDPLGRRPLYGTSFQMVPGSVWGNSPYDLMKDCQDMCNAAARALAANLGISSGPQVGILSDRLSPTDDATEMFPWKVWQFEADPMGSTASPITFFQPQSNANELMTVYERFSLLADEYTGIPRYMAGFNGGEGGAGRTASGISMMISNATKIIKQVVGAIDTNVLTPLLERLHYYNMRYGDDPDLKGDVYLIARGAMSIVAKEAAQVRMNEFLQVALTSPAVQQIIGIEGLAELLRPTVKRLDINPDRVVPPTAVIKQRQAEAMMQQMMLMNQQGGQDGRSGQGQPEQKPGGERLQDGSPTVDNFSPRAQ